jgi:DNA excision repair protein ERCC-2
MGQFTTGQSQFEFLAHEVPRPGQVDMIRDCVSALRKKGNHLAAAPTGIGKTAAALAAALEVSLVPGEEKTVFFLTSRQTQHRIVVDTVRKINVRRGKQSNISLIDMIGQSGMCVQEFAKESPFVFSLMCSQARKSRTCKPWMTKADGLREQFLSYPLHVDELVEKVVQHTENGRPAVTCPWKIARESVAFANVFVGDYNHLFDDGVRENSLKAMGLNLENIIIIVDEAHNLPDRIRMTMERKLTPTMVKNVYTELEEYEETYRNIVMQTGGDLFQTQYELIVWVKSVFESARKVFSDFFASLNKQLKKDDDEIEVKVEDIFDLLHKACDIAEGRDGQHKLVNNENFQIQPVNRIRILRDILANVDVDVEVGDGEDPMEPDALRFSELLRTLDRFQNTNSVVLIFDGKGKDGRITSHLLDPGMVAAPIFEQAAGSILMSGTLYPPSMYADILGFTKLTTHAHYTSPFAAKRRPVLIAKDVTTKFSERSQENSFLIQQHIQTLIDATPGNIAVFAPSYAMLEQIVGLGHYSGTRLMMENRDWTKKDLDGVVETLLHEKQNQRKILLGGVFGARLSEGIDYNNGALDAVICVGIPNSPPSLLSKALTRFAEERFGKNLAWKYTISQPAINSILQAMGRPIRSVADRAMILLLDKRNDERTYSSCYPPDLQMIPCHGSEHIRQYAERFFRTVHREVGE